MSYDNSIKKSVLHVDDVTLNTVGAVSEETVEQMLEGILNVMQTDYAIAVSGIMGPLVSKKNLLALFGLQLVIKIKLKRRNSSFALIEKEILN